jgi:hypothetical protein
MTTLAVTSNADFSLLVLPQSAHAKAGARAARSNSVLSFDPLDNHDVLLRHEISGEQLTHLLPPILALSAF